MDLFCFCDSPHYHGYERETNKLKAVIDHNNTMVEYGDLKKGQDYDAANPVVDNYQYDEIGNLVKDQQEGITNIDWTVYGKVGKVEKTDGSTIFFAYDAAGNRISKREQGNGQDRTTYYVRDASGNVMANYVKDNEGFKLTEQAIYGSDRIGQRQETLILAGASSLSEIKRRSVGLKVFELKNHLGNVLATVSDRKDKDGNAVVLSASDYYPFGMQMANPNNVTGYRYGFNGMERDDEIKGLGNSYTTEFRQYDPRIGRWLSIDPAKDKFPFQSPYIGMDNKPIIRNDVSGDCPTCGAAAAGAVVGALMDMVIQVGEHMYNGDDMKTAISKIDYVSVSKEAGIGALAGLSGFGAARYMKKAMQVLKSPAGRAAMVFLTEQAVDMAVSQMAEYGYETSGMEAAMYGMLGYSPKTSHQLGKIGEEETLKELNQKYKGQTVNVTAQVTGEFQDGKRTIFDFVVTDESGDVIEVVESKVNKSQLTRNQKRFYDGGESIKFVGANAQNANLINKTASTADTFASVFKRTVNRYTGTASKSVVRGAIRKLIK